MMLAVFWNVDSRFSYLIYCTGRKHLFREFEILWLIGFHIQI